MTTKTSELINYLRFPMMIGIVFCHTLFFKWLSADELTGGPENTFPVLFYTSYIISDLIRNPFVMLFFLFSGYLFFKDGELTPQRYADKLRRRAFSLLLPYILWNIIVLGVMVVQERFLGGASERMGTIRDYQWKDLLFAFYDTTQSWHCTGLIGQPANTVLWFLRDLMILVVLSPLFYLIAKIPKHLGVIVLLIIYLIPYHLPHLHNSACFAFGLGALMSVRQIDLASFAEKNVWTFGLLTILSLGLFLVWESEYLWRIYAVCEIFCILGLTVKLLDKTTFRFPTIIQQSAFFIYLSHVIPTATLCYLTCRLLPHEDWIFTLSYFAIPILVSVCSVAVYSILQHFFPRFTSLLVGGR